MIELNHVSKRFGNNQILNDISFTVGAGERISLLGPGGCGKSTILKILLGLEPPNSGSVKLFSLDMSRASEFEKQENLKQVGVAFQQGGLFDHMTVAENIQFAMEHMTDLSPEQRDRKIDHLLHKVKLPRTKHMFPFELSGGMKRRIGIARALATDPKIALFDEPTSGLDPVTSTIILNMIGDLGDDQEGSTLIVSTTSVEVAIRFAKRVVLVKDGYVIADGYWGDLLVHGDAWVKNFLGTRLIGIDISYAHELGLPNEFIKLHW